MSTARLNHEARILRVCWDNGDFVRDVDNYWYFWPNRNNGSWSEYDLLAMARILNAANRKWDNELAEYFGGK